MWRTLLVTSLLVAVSLTGCLADLSEPEERDDVPGPADETDLGSPATHGEPSITWGPVHTERTDDGSWRAWQVATITNDFGGAARSVVDLNATSGGIVVVPLGELRAPEAVEGPVGYLVLANRTAQAATEDEAVRAMETVDVVHEDALKGGTLHLSTRIELVPSDPTQLEPDDLLGLVGSSNRGGSIEAALPRQPVHDLRARTGSGGVVVAGLDFTGLDARTNSGGVSLEAIASDRVHAETTSGGITVGGSFADLVARTNSGGVEARAEPTSTGTFDLSSSSGGVVLTLLGDRDNGYDVRASTTSGGVSISIPDGEPVGEQSDTRQHVRTRAYDAKPVRTAVTASTTSGGVVVTG